MNVDNLYITTHQIAIAFAIMIGWMALGLVISIIAMRFIHFVERTARRANLNQIN